MASIREHRGGHQVRYRRRDGTAGGRSFPTRRKAEEWRDLLRRVGPGDAERALEHATPDTPTLHAFAEHYITHQTGIEEGTRAKDVRLVLTWGPELLELPVTLVTRDHVARWVNAQAAAGFQEKTIRNRQSKLSQVLAAAVDEGHLPRNYAYRVKVPRTLKEEGVFLTPDQAGEIVRQLDPWWWPLVGFMLATGCRWQEATAVRWGDMDLAARPDPTVRITRAWKDRPGGDYVGVTKTRRSTRTVRIFGGPGVIALLQAHRINREAIGVGGVGEADLAFVTPERGSSRGGYRVNDRFRSGQVGTTANPAHCFRDAVDAALPGVTPRPTPHDFRHTHASMLRRAGHDIEVVQRQLGHEKSSTTLDVYGHLGPDPWTRQIGADAWVTLALAPTVVGVRVVHGELAG